VRGFENILLNKKLIDVPRIVSRVCGLCYASQTIASCKAIENIFEIEPSYQSIQLRRLLMIGELINSHSFHFFFQAFPDLFVLLKGYEKPLSLEELIRYDPQMTGYMFDLIKTGKELVNIFGGRYTHPITPIVGGMANAPPKKSIGVARKYIQKVIENTKWIIEKYQEFIANTTPPDEFNLENQVFLGIQNKGVYNNYLGMLRLKQNGEMLADFPFNDYSQYIDRDRNLPGIYTHINGEQRLLVGPLARYNVIDDYGISDLDPYLEIIDKSWQKNLLISNYLRLLEILLVSYEGLKILEDSKLTNPIEIQPQTTLRNPEGIGVVEAPRGTLIHHYQANNKLVLEQVKLLVATEINIPTINAHLTKQGQKFYQMSQDLEKVKRQAQMIVRSFDPCISCATH
jgi:F420-non-reducing hydrogenase large subunit